LKKNNRKKKKTDYEKGCDERDRKEAKNDIKIKSKSF